jgi:hypothetical protein
MESPLFYELERRRKYEAAPQDGNAEKLSPPGLSLSIGAAPPFVKSGVNYLAPPIGESVTPMSDGDARTRPPNNQVRRSSQ